jgi:L-ascorbate metabolism protein UlaG (beta-lactamase superfamily)
MSNSRKAFEFRKLHDHSDHISIASLRREATRVAMLPIESILAEFDNWGAEFEKLEAKHKVHKKEVWE